MEDVVPELLSKIKKDFDSKYNSNKTIKKLLKKLDDDDLNHQISLEYASNVGNVLKEVFDSNLSSKTLPDGKLYFNIADRIINDTLKNNFDLITDYCDKVQKSLNDVAKIKIKPIKPTLNQDKVKGIVEIVSGKDNYNDVAYMLGEPIVNFSQCIVDDYVKANADFHSKSGMKAQIIRTSNGKCCDWCNKLVGVYDYEEVKNGHDVFRRHRHCDCVVEYKTINGRAQNVHTKYWKKIEESVKIEERKEVVGFHNMSRTRQKALEKGIEFNPIKPRLLPKTENGIIEELGGGDLTKGSCSSLAFAYAGNKAGYKVLDFRDGDSRELFKSWETVFDISRLNGVISYIERHTNDLKAVGSLVEKMKNGKEYYLATGRHAAIIRKSDGRLSYLELQDSKYNGYKPLTNWVLKDRFKCKETHTL